MENTMYGSLDDLLDDCPIEILARKLTMLKRAGRNKMVGCCPFHAEGTASFHIGPLDKAGREQRFWCHGCGVQGDAVDLMAHAEGTTREKVLAERVRSAAAPEHEAGEDIGF